MRVRIIFFLYLLNKIIKWIFFIVLLSELYEMKVYIKLNGCFVIRRYYFYKFLVYKYIVINDKNRLLFVLIFFNFERINGFFIF